MALLLGLFVEGGACTHRIELHCRPLRHGL